MNQRQFRWTRGWLAVIREWTRLGFSADQAKGWRLAADLGQARTCRLLVLGPLLSTQSQPSGQPAVSVVLAAVVITAIGLATGVALLRARRREFLAQEAARDSEARYSILMERMAEDRKQNEDQRREQALLLAYHIDHSPLAVIEWGPDMRLIRWAGEAEHLFGWRAEEVLGKRMEDFRWIYQEDQAQVTQVSEALQSGGAPKRFSANRNYHKDGSIVHCEWYNSSLDLVALVRGVSEDYQAVVESNSLTLKVQVDGPDWTRLSVKDTGAGLPPDQVAAIFEPFMQRRETVGRSRNGLGLGLALVKGLVAMHGGAVAAHSDGPGLGSEFSLRLPVVKPGGGLGPEPAEAAVRASLAPCRILVIEDLVDAATTLQLLLQALGHVVAVAHNGQAGLAQASAFQPDIVLCDIGLPGELDGYAVARAIRRDPRLQGSHLIAMTGFGTPADQARALQAGFDPHLTKPVDPAALEGILGARLVNPAG